MAAGITTDKYGTIKTSHGHGDFVFVKLNTAGDITWQKTVGGSRTDYVSDIQTDSNNDIVFVGNSNSDNDDLYQHSANNNRQMVAGKIGTTNMIKGKVFIDNNGNHLREAGEPLYSQGKVVSVKRTDSIAAGIFNGYFLNIVDTGLYITSFKPANNYYTVYPVTRNSNFAAADLQDSVDFALTPLTGINDLETTVVPLSPLTPGSSNAYRIITKNVGTANISNVVIGLKKDSRQTYVSASRTRSGIQADSIWWGPFVLNANGIDTLTVSLNAAVSPSLNSGDTLSLSVTVNPLLNDSSVANNVFRLRQLVNDSLPVNNKTEIHAGTFTTTQYRDGEYLQYLVRFQNTGTDTAFYITIKDTLQPGLDLNTLQVVAASHAYSFRLNGNIATWDFNKIKLPAMGTNLAASRGYILFKIKPAANLSGGDEFNNKAAIYFDYHLPVITNEENTTLGVKEGFCPNDNVTFSAGISGSAYQWQVNMGNGFTNLSNNSVYSGVTTNTLTLTSASTGMYGYVYRAVVNGNTLSNGQILKFALRWNGSVSTAWENAANWDCGAVPDAKTDVIIPIAARYPLVSANASCFSLRLSPGSTVTVKSNANLSISGKAN